MPAKECVVVDATINSGTSQSNKVFIGPFVVVAIIMPAGWDAAAITFLASDQRGQAGNKGVVDNFLPVFDDVGNEVTIPTAAAAAGRFVTFHESDPMSGVSYLKVRSGTNATPVNQTATRVLQLVCREE